jgi:cell division protein FtsI/penicillin-binding protein 2
VLSSTVAFSSQRATISFPSIRFDEESVSATNNQGERVEVGLRPDLQKHLERVLSNARPISGAAALVDAQTGQVLAAAEVGETSKSLLFEPVAPAASVFKIVTTAALFEKTDVTPLTRVCTRGGQRNIEREHLTAARGADAVCTKFAYALGVSRNAAYAQLATQKLMRDDLIQMAADFGFNRPLLLDAYGHAGTLDVPYNDLAFARTAAGFENSRLSVFGGAQLAMIIASGGLLRPMHFAKADADADEPVRVLASRTAHRIRDAMEVTIHSGTARSSFVNDKGRSTVGPVQVAGKTGTLKPARDAPTASWFIGFAPSDHPRVVVSVVLQNPDRWVRRGHEVGRDLLRVYLESIGVSKMARP